MDELIYKQAAIDALAKYIHNVDKVIGTGRLSAYDCKDAATSVFKDLPSAQSEIIYCKDCMHNGSFDTDCPIHWDGKDYCSFAERREDE